MSIFNNIFHIKDNCFIGKNSLRIAIHKIWSTLNDKYFIFQKENGRYSISKSYHPTNPRQTSPRGRKVFN